MAAAVISVGSVVATAAGPSPESAASLSPSALSLPSLLGPNGDRPTRSSERVLRASARAHGGRRSVAEVRRLVRGLAPSLAGVGSIVPEPSTVERILGPTAVQLKQVDGKPGGALVSSMPIAVEVPAVDGAEGAGAPTPAADANGTAPRTWELADLGLRASDGRLAVERAPVEISLPETAAGSIRVGDLRMRLAPAGSTAAGTVVGESVTYPGVAADTDLVVRSLPIGVDVGWLLRSPVASKTLRVPLDLAGGRSAVTVDETGAATVRDGAGSTVATVSATKAIDAGGQPVPVKVTADADGLVIAVDHQAGVTQYPVIVDPVFATDWDQASTDFAGWREAKSAVAAPFSFQKLPTPGPTLFSGITVFADRQVSPAGTWGAWARPAPGDQSVGTLAASGRRVSSEHAYWTSMSVTGADYFSSHVLNQTPPTGRFAFASPQGWGDWSSLPQEYDRVVKPSGPVENAKPGPWTFTSEQIGTSGTLRAKTNVPGNVFVSGLLSSGDAAPATKPASDPTTTVSSLNIGAIQLTAMDSTYPTIEVPTPADEEWVNENDAVQARVTDRGTGVASIQLRDTNGTQLYPGEGAGEGALAGPSCPASGDVLCRFEAGQMFPVSSLSEGRRMYTVLAQDGGGRTASKALVFGIDMSDPEVLLSGDLYDQRTSEIPAGTLRSLTVDATDGDPENTRMVNRRSGVGRIEIYVDDELVKEEEQTDSFANAPLSTTWTPDADTFAAGDYTVRVVTADRAGHEDEQQFVVHAPCCTVPLGEATVVDGGRLYRLGDVDGDQKSDVVLVAPASGAIGVRTGKGDGTFDPEVPWGTFGAAVGQIAVGDLDGDRRDDVVAQTTAGGLLTRLSTDTGSVAPPEAGSGALETSWPLGRSLEVANVNGDESDDVWGVDASGGQLWLASGTDVGPLPAEAQIAIPTTRKVSMADLDGDGADDLVTYEPSDGTVRFRTYETDGFSATSTWGTGPTGGDVTAGDVNADGLDDVLFRLPGGTVPDGIVVRQSSASGGFIAGQRALGTLASSYDLAARDINADGRADVVGTRLDPAGLVIRSVGSVIPDPEEADPRPIDPDGTAGALERRLPSKPVAMAQADTELLWRQNIGFSDGEARSSFDNPALAAAARTRVRQQLDQLRYLGITRLRVFVWWGMVDRLAPGTTPAVVPDEPHFGQVAGMDGLAPYTSDDAFADVSLATPLRVKNRWAWYVWDELIKQASDAGLKVHLTLSGGNRATTTECSRYMPDAMFNLSPRGCRGSGVAPPGLPVPAPDADVYRPTGRDPNPTAFGHFVAEAVKHFRSIPGGESVESIGLWNEPNLQPGKGISPGGFLTVANDSGLRIKPTKDKEYYTDSAGKAMPNQNRSTAALYGKLYAAGYQGLRQAGAASVVTAAFGELSSGRSYYHRVAGDGTGKEGQITPSTWTDKALASAKTEWAVRDLPGKVPIVPRFAVHPYQHSHEPWVKDSKYTFGVAGLSRSVNSSTGRGVKRTLNDAASAGSISTTSRESGGSVPQIWATEFGYWNAAPSPKQDGRAHTENERRKWLRYTGSGKPGEGGALQRLYKDGGVGRVNFYGAFEQVPKALNAPTEDYGYIGSAPQEAFPPRDFVYPLSELGNLQGSRPYQKQGSKITAAPARRQVACLLRGFFASEGVAMPKSQYEPVTAPDPNRVKRCS